MPAEEIAVWTSSAAESMFRLSAGSHSYMSSSCAVVRRRYASADQAVLLRDVDVADARLRRGSRLPVVSRTADAIKLMCPDGRVIDAAAAAGGEVWVAAGGRRSPSIRLERHPGQAIAGFFLVGLAHQETDIGEFVGFSMQFGS